MGKKDAKDEDREPSATDQSKCCVRLVSLIGVVSAHTTNVVVWQAPCCWLPCVSLTAYVMNGFHTNRIDCGCAGTKG